MENNVVNPDFTVHANLNAKSMKFLNVIERTKTYLEENMVVK
jgi:hypothetical protein